MTDNFLFFSGRSSPYIFTQFTEFLVRARLSRGFVIFGYLDDFIVLGSSMSRCRTVISVLYALLSLCGFKVADNKLVLPTHKLVYLGIQLDSGRMEVALPPDKVIL